MAGYPRVIGGYVAGYYPGVGAEIAPPMAPMAPMLPVHPSPHAAVHSAPWRPMLAPGSPPLGEGHVPIPLNPETNSGTWGNTAAGGAATSATITFSARPQKPYKTTRILIGRSGTPGGLAAAHLVGQVYIGTDLQQGEVGIIDLETLGAGGSFDTWVSFKQAEPGVWI